MKKMLLFATLLVIILPLFASCSNTNPNTETTTDSQQTTTDDAGEASKQVWEVFEELSKKQYSKIELNIQTVMGDVELNANYTLTNSNVTYSVEQLTLLPSGENIDGASLNYKTTLTGTATIENGKVTKLDGDDVTLPSNTELVGSFNFDSSNFKNVKTEDGKLTADVISPSNFTGTSKNLSDMKIVVSYNETALQELEISYKTTNATVTTVYEFTK